jgi:hypothetical protein
VCGVATNIPFANRTEFMSYYLQSVSLDPMKVVLSEWVNILNENKKMTFLKCVVFGEQ